MTPQQSFQRNYDAFGNVQSTTVTATPTDNNGLLPNNITQPTNPTAIISGQVASTIQTDKVIVGGGKQITITPQDDIQQALDDINEAGGGTLLLSSGTYKIPRSLKGYSNIKISGTSTYTTILDFQNQAYSLSFSGTNVYTTGTVTAITSNIFVTGSGTKWSTNVQPGYQIFLGTRWYKIAAVTSDTSLILGEGYGDNLTLPTTYRIANICVNPILENMTFQNSTTTALQMTDARFVNFYLIKFSSCNVGFNLTNTSETNFQNVDAVACTSDGFQFTNMGLTTAEGLIAAGNGGNGFTLNNVKSAAFFFCASDANVGTGLSLTTVVGCEIAFDASGNGGKGIEMVSGCQLNFINPGTFVGNVSDGLKLTASNSYNILGPVATASNGGYGVNIADASNTKNVLYVNVYNSNTAGTYQDLGTSTTIVT